MECYTCRSLSGEKRISPGPFIYKGNYWVIDHAYPSSLQGWLVLLPKRHIEALHELSREEFAELAEIQYKVSQVMSQYPTTQKEYMACYAEAANFHHIHIHFVAKPQNLPTEARGPRSFSLLNVDEQHAIPPAEIIAFCEDFRARYLALD